MYAMQQTCFMTKMSQCIQFHGLEICQIHFLAKFIVLFVFCFFFFFAKLPDSYKDLYLVSKLCIYASV